MKKASCFIFAACCLSLLCSGCAVPYFASIRGPIRRIRVLDAENNTDIAEATVSLTTQTSQRFLGPPPCSLTYPDLCEVQACALRGHLLRNKDLSFHVSSGLGMGSHGFFTGRPEDPNEYPRGVVIVDARGYRPAMLRYTVGNVQPGWTCVETMAEGEADSSTDNGAIVDVERPWHGARCEFGADGVLRFYLRPLKVI